MVVIGLLAYVIYRQVFAREDFPQLWETFRARFAWLHSPWLIAAVLLVPVNWLLETIKWRRLVRGFLEFSLYRTYLAILAGLSIGIVTPSRVGEYGGRAVLVAPEHNWRSVVATFVGNLAQLIVLLIGGLLGSIWFFSRVYPLGETAVWTITAISVVFIGGLLFLFFQTRRALPYLHRKLPVRFKKVLSQLDQLRHYNNAELRLALFYSVLRYLVFTGQYYLLLRFYGIELDYPTALAAVATIFFLHSGLPLPPVVGLLARGEIALFVWGHFSDLDLNILATTYTLFVLNLAVPALLGALVIAQTDVAGSFGYGRKRKQSIGKRE